MKIHTELLKSVLTDKSPMTKQQEIAVLDKAIAALGPDSYLGPWLTQVRAEVESAIRSDYFPEITLKGAREAAAHTLATAQLDAAEVIAKSESEANRIKRAANLHLDQVASALSEAQRAIQRI